MNMIFYFIFIFIVAYPFLSLPYHREHFLHRKNKSYYDHKLCAYLVEMIDLLMLRGELIYLII